MVRVTILKDSDSNIYKASLTDGDVVQIVQLVHQRPHNSDVDTHIPQLRVAEVVLNNGRYIAAYPVDVCVDREMAVWV